MGHEGQLWGVSLLDSTVGSRAECLGDHSSSSWGSGEPPYHIMFASPVADQLLAFPRVCSDHHGL